MRTSNTKTQTLQAKHESMTNETYYKQDIIRSPPPPGTVHVYCLSTGRYVGKTELESLGCSVSESEKLSWTASLGVALEDPGDNKEKSLSSDVTLLAERLTCFFLR